MTYKPMMTWKPTTLDSVPMTDAEGKDIGFPTSGVSHSDTLLAKFLKGLHDVRTGMDKTISNNPM
jgi:hypothetical protein